MKSYFRAAGYQFKPESITSARPFPDSSTRMLAAWFIGLAPGEATARVALALASVLVCDVALRGDPVDLARASRRALALTLVGGPLLMLGALVAEGRGEEAPTIVALFGVFALVVGASASWLEEPLRPARGAWLGLGVGVSCGAGGAG